MAHPKMYQYVDSHFLVIDVGTREWKLVGVYPGLDTSTGITSTGWYDQAQAAAEQYLEKNPGVNLVSIVEATHGLLVKLKYNIVKPPGTI